ncbi:hypothetical protein FS815_24540 [Agrobacterium vitis]|uniref:hypothetical protein n=1 Tax=Allorhizobium ampelinum TaxID=3025782 RepID=UPI001F1CD576|nr:hypothetical protein [Allorhizobium ampelinum]MCF1449962.1 hypothetical protein [Allorhizobium ampelinum]
MTEMRLSIAIGELVAAFMPCSDIRDDEVIQFSGKDARKIFQILNSMQSLAFDMEVELDCFRDVEAGKLRTAAANSEAAKTLGELLVEAGGKIIRPDFRGRT